MSKSPYANDPGPGFRHKDIPCEEFLCLPEKNPDHYERVGPPAVAAQPTDPPSGAGPANHTPPKPADFPIPTPGEAPVEFDEVVPEIRVEPSPAPMLDDVLRSTGQTATAPAPPVEGVGEVTVVESFYHQNDGQQPWALAGGYSVRIKSDEQPYVRHLRVGSEWVALDRGWIERASLLFLRNDEGRDLLQRVPTAAEKLAVARREVLVGVAVGPSGVDVVPLARLAPSATVRLCPLDLASVRIRCLSDRARLTLVLLPE